MIRELVFSWEAWAIWYTTAGIIWTARSKLKKSSDSGKLPAITYYDPESTEDQDIPKTQPMYAANVEADNVYDIRSNKPDRPEWMK